MISPIPNNFVPDDWVKCPSCQGKGGWALSENTQPICTICAGFGYLSPKRQQFLQSLKNANGELK
jgi:DnaJ-class molecular chaperone